MRLFKSLMPKWIQRKIYNHVKTKIIQNNKIQSRQIPKYAIRTETIQNTKLLLNREELLKILPKNGTVAELGVDEGSFSAQILNICNPKKLHLIDFWGFDRYNQDKKRQVEEKFKSQINSGNVQIDIGFSTEIGQKFQDNHFDWIYIDTDHSYQTTIKELEIWKSKVKVNGLIAGHDYIIGYWDGMVRYGVIEAVYEFCSKNNWEILYLTMELNNHPSFAIRRIDNKVVEEQKV